MQLPSVDRQPGMRAAGADLVPATGAQVVPVAPVNPPVTSEASTSLQPPPSVVNRIGEASQEPPVVYSSAPDTTRRTVVQDPTSPRDWTIQKPPQEEVKEEVPPPEPISKMLMEFIKSMWRASGGVVEASQAQTQSQAATDASNLVTGQAATENLTYVPSKINRNEAV